MSSTGLNVTGALLAGDLRLPSFSSQKFRKSSSPLDDGDLSAPYTCSWLLSRGKVLTTLSNSKRFALGKEAEDGFLSNVSEDSDEMFDDLFKKYGKVAYKSDDLKSPTAEVDDDADSLAFAVEMAKVAIDAIGSRMRDMAEKKYGKVANGDVKPNAWTLLDFGDVVDPYLLTSAKNLL